MAKVRYTKLTRPSRPKVELHLPIEVLLRIVSFIPRNSKSQPTLHAFSLVARSWYSASIHRLYHSPRITGRNFDAFIRTVCPSINSHVRRSDLAEMIRELDLSKLIHHGTRSLLARLLRRAREHLEVFVAPAATFSLNSYAALSKCHRLRSLNLEIVSECIDLPKLFASISKLHNLNKLYLSRVYADEPAEDAPEIPWPPNLKSLTISGTLRAWSDKYMNSAPPPPGLVSFRLDSHTGDLAENLLTIPYELDEGFGWNLRSLEIYHPLELDWNTHDGHELNPGYLITDHPNLRYLTLHVTWVSEVLFGDIETSNNHHTHPLESFKIFGEPRDNGTPRRGNPELEMLRDSLQMGQFKKLQRVTISSNLVLHEEDDISEPSPPPGVFMPSDRQESEPGEEDVQMDEANPSVLNLLIRELEKAGRRKDERGGHEPSEAGLWIIPA